MYSGEYDVCGVTTSWKIYPARVGIDQDYLDYIDIEETEFEFGIMVDSQRD